MGKQRRRVARAHFKALAEAAAKAEAEKVAEAKVVEKPKPITKKFKIYATRHNPFKRQFRYKGSLWKAV